MWQDPPLKIVRKPQRLRGTPLNKYVHLATFGLCSAISAFGYWYSHSEIGFIKKNREAKIKAILEPSEESIAQRTMFEDGFCVPSALAIIQERKKMKDYNLDPPERDDTID